MISRRDFVSHAGTSALVMSCFPAAVLAARRGDPTVVTFSSGLRKSTFEALLSQNFYAPTPHDGVMVLQLVNLKDGTVSLGKVKTEGFTLYFRGLASPLLDDGIYTLEHGSAGKVSLYLEAAQLNVDSAVYRAQCCLLI